MEILVPSHVGIHNVVKTFFISPFNSMGATLAVGAALCAVQVKITITQLQNQVRTIVLPVLTHTVILEYFNIKE